MPPITAPKRAKYVIQPKMPTVNTSKVPVTIIGPAEVVNALSANDIVVEVDLSTREISQTGQYRIQAEVFLPGGENAWAIGRYSITITVKEK